MGDFIMTTCSYIFKNINQRTYDFHKQNELEKKTNCATCIYQIPRTKFSQIKVSDKYLSHRFFFQFILFMKIIFLRCFKNYHYFQFTTAKLIQKFRVYKS